MSPIFNQSALRGLSTETLHHLRSIVLQRLGGADVSDGEQAQLRAALECVHAVLCNRAVPQSPSPATPSP